MRRITADGLELKDHVIAINRVTKVVKGGKNLSFSALVVVGDENGVVGYGTGKAREVPLAIRKGIEAAKKNLIRVPLNGTTIPHQTIGRFGAGHVIDQETAFDLEPFVGLANGIPDADGLVLVMTEQERDPAGDLERSFFDHITNTIR